MDAQNFTTMFNQIVWATSEKLGHDLDTMELIDLQDLVRDEIYAWMDDNGITIELTTK